MRMAAAKAEAAAFCDSRGCRSRPPLPPVARHAVSCAYASMSARTAVACRRGEGFNGGRVSL